MSGRLASFLVVVVALVCYHIAQRAMPASIKPAALFTFVYAIAAAGMVAAVAFSGSSGGASAVLKVSTHWAPWLLAAAVAGIELGIYAMYQSGWSISTAGSATQAVAAAVLVVVGLLSFGEHLTPTRAAGLALCVAGGALVAR